MQTHPASLTRGVRRRMVAIATSLAVAAGALVAGSATAGAEPVTITNATLEWGVSAEMQSAPPFGGCNYLSAGTSDGTQASYQTSNGNVTVLKNGVAPSWATKCDGASGGNMNQKVVWSGGNGTVDPATGTATLAFTGQLSLTFYGGLVPFTIMNPTLTVAANGTGQLVGNLVGYASDIDNPFEKEPMDPVPGVVIANLSGVSIGANGFTVTPDYAGVIYDPPTGSDATPQNRTNPGWGSWPASFVDFHIDSGLNSYWYSSGGAADPKKAPSAITINYNTGSGGEDPGDGGEDPGEDPGDDGENPELSDLTQTITVEIPELDDGEFLWSIQGDGQVDLGTAEDQGAYLEALGSLDPISVTDNRTDGPAWSISGQVSNFTNGLDGKYLGWTPSVTAAGAGATAGSAVLPGISSGQGLKTSSLLASATEGHDGGTAQVGAGLTLRLPIDTEAGQYSATLTLTALS